VKNGALKQMPQIEFCKNHDNHERHRNPDAKDDDLGALHFHHSAAHSASDLFKNRVMEPPVATGAAGSHPLVFVSAIVARDIQSRSTSFAFIPAPGI
jgi:hypothetical protein